MELLNDSGLSSLSGFSYQIKVFILRLTQLQQGQRVEFETLDDVLAIEHLPFSISWVKIGKAF